MQGFVFLILLWSGSLFAIAGLRHLLLSPPITAADWLAFGLHVAPVVLMLPGVLATGSRTSKTQFVIVALVGMWFFTLGVVFASGAEGRALGLAEVAIALVLTATASIAASRLPTPPKSEGP
ncbi:MAG: DUF2069 domain-containing protein [Pseudomonadota bacterium]